MPKSHNLYEQYLEQPSFEVMSKRRRGYPSETKVKRGARYLKGGKLELSEKLGAKDLCPCGSTRSFQEML